MKISTILLVGLIYLLSCPAIYSQILINEFYADVASGLVGDANGDGIRNPREDEFIELVNPSDSIIDLTGFTLWVSENLRHEFLEETVLDPESSIVIFGGGEPTGTFGNSIIVTANSGALGLGNSGAKVELIDPVGEIVEEFIYPDENINASWTREPDITGGFKSHHLVRAAYGVSYSPGTLLNSFPFGLSSNTFIHFPETKGIVFEGDDLFRLPVYLINPSAEHTSFEVTLINRTGTEEDLLDFVPPVFIFSPNEGGRKYIDIPIKDDRLIEGNEQLQFTITNIRGGKDATLSVNQFFELTIEDNDFDFPLILNEIHADPVTGIEGDANKDGQRNAREDEFLEFINNSTEVINISGYKIFDSSTLRHEIPEGTILEPSQAYVVFGGGEPTGSFGNAIVQIASTGGLNLLNTGDKISLKDTIDTVVYAYQYKSEAANNQSITRFPDLVEMDIKTLHSTVGEGVLFSPGKRVDGSLFYGTVPVEDLPTINVSIYPNPAKNYLVIDGLLENDILKVELWNMAGQLVVTSNYNDRLFLPTEFQGIYLVKIHMGEGVLMKQIIVQ